MEPFGKGLTPSQTHCTGVKEAQVGLIRAAAQLFVCCPLLLIWPLRLVPSVGFLHPAARFVPGGAFIQRGPARERQVGPFGAKGSCPLSSLGAYPPSPELISRAQQPSSCRAPTTGPGTRLDDGALEYDSAGGDETERVGQISQRQSFQIQFSTLSSYTASRM
ncbi:hypothetical protein IRJ41_013135 [Triplophysa rosa]|uniref:Uncharacterized protein n=1 Tax=Triplophysa rosa TaxID=992332 RepID=A0A9W8C1F8_TRIRA|nr:hypothetical protein IRJ41_013135 [Triplophysa rosa]